MKITKQWLIKHRACKPGIEAFCDQNETDSIKILNLLIRSNKQEKLQWANWLIVRLFKNKKQKIMYAIFAAKLVVKHFEEKYPSDLILRKTIEATEKYLNNPSQKNKDIASAAAEAAYAAYAAAWVASEAAAGTVYAASSAAFSAAYAASAYAASAASSASASAASSAAAWAASYAASAAYTARAANTKITAYNKTLTEILEYGITLPIS